ncbi:MAG: phosphoenolpyruvate synthase [Candidatus Nealsonbacteria bacterium]|nr:phosphoenolpyruvate synthase [Candidatus Nealsonbacteria bacterium]
MKKGNIFWFRDLSSGDVPLVGGKNASLGEMHQRLAAKGVNLPDGFVLTADAYWHYLSENKIDEKLKELFKKLEASNLASLKKTGAAARRLIMEGSMPSDLEDGIIRNYQELSREYKMKNADVAVRSSATAEDLPSASFAGQHETYLNVVGVEELLEAVKKCMASLFTDRAIAYREEKGFEHLKIALSVGIQKMVRSDLASAGVIFTLDTETGFDKVVLVNSIWGVGEMIVKGKITPDEFFVFKPTLKQGFKPIIVKNLGRKNKKYIYGDGGLKEEAVSLSQQLKFSLTDEDVLKLAEWACLIEDHYKLAQDIEWAKDGKTGQLFIVQSRPETVFTPKTVKTYEEYQIKTQKKPLLFGIAIGNKIGTGRVRIISSIKNAGSFQKGEVLVTAMTDPDWVPIMRLASAIVTNEGGKTAHAAIVSRELGLPAIVGTGKATQVLKTGQTITVDCTQGLKGRIYEGRIPFEIKKYNFDKIAKTRSKLMVNIGAPEIAFKTSFLPVEGVGLAREEFIIAEKIRVHPLALYHFEKLKDKKLKKKIEEITVEHKDKKEFFVKELAEGVAQIAAAFWPNEVIVRFSDFKTNEYKNLVGGELYEQEESNPMLGFRGASRYLDKDFEPAFNMECQAVKRAREVFGLKNISVMVPFCRTVEEGSRVVELIKKFGLEDKNLKIYVMAEIPSNIILAEQFLEVFDGMSIGSNDLTQLMLGIDRDNAKIAGIGDERNEAVKRMIAEVIKICRLKNKYVGICGQAPSDFPEFAEFLEEQGISSISLNPDTVIKTLLHLTKAKT